MRPYMHDYIKCNGKDIRLQIMKILQTFIQMICLALQFTNLSPVYKSDISRYLIIKF